MDIVQNYLYLLSNALLLPTLLVMLGLTAWCTLLIGGLIRECFLRSQIQSALRQGSEFARNKDLSPEQHQNSTMDCLRSCTSGIPARFVQRLGKGEEDQLECQKALEDVESDVASSLARLTWLTRVAPMLGLMGTLIPLGPALTGLAAGDIAMLSGNLVVAFTATVIGVLIGCVSFSLGLVRRNWYQRDMSDLEYIIARLHSSTPYPPK